jgi:hypothetical protein
MVQGKVKHKVSLNGVSKKDNSIAKHKKNKGKQPQKTYKKVNTVQKIVQKNLESSIKSNIEKDLCSQVKSMEGKSFNLLK